MTSEITSLVRTVYSASDNVMVSKDDGDRRYMLLDSSIIADWNRLRDKAYGIDGAATVALLESAIRHDSLSAKEADVMLDNWKVLSMMSKEFIR